MHYLTIINSNALFNQTPVLISGWLDYAGVGRGGRRPIRIRIPTVLDWKIVYSNNLFSTRIVKYENLHINIIVILYYINLNYIIVL